MVRSSGIKDFESCFCYVDTIDGNISYAKNNKWLDVAFDEGALFRSGEILAAVSMAGDLTCIELIESASLMAYDF